MLPINKFEYIPLTRAEVNGDRLYDTPDGNKLPSVTTILSKVTDMTHIKEWEERIGVAEANKIKTDAGTLGSAMHYNIECHLRGKAMVGHFMPKTLAGVIIKNGLKNVNEVWGIEVGLYSTGLYAGTTDLVGVFNNKPSIIDFKNSLKPKKIEWIDNYRAQLGAYALAHNEMFNTDIRQGVIMIATREGKYQEFIFTDGEFDKCVDLWLEKLQKYLALPKS